MGLVKLGNTQFFWSDGFFRGDGASRPAELVPSLDNNYCRGPAALGGDRIDGVMGVGQGMYREGVGGGRERKEGGARRIDSRQ